MDVFDPWSNAPEWSNGIPPEIHPPDAEVLTLLLDEVKRDRMLVLEVGSWVGNGSTRVIVEAIRDVGGTLYCVDTWQGSDNVEPHQEFRRQYNDLFAVFCDNVRAYGAEDVVRPLVAPSIEASKSFADETFDLIFIDGNHAYSHAKQDILAWLPKVRFGGILCGHDCDADYAALDDNLKSEIERHAEQDVLENSSSPGPPAFHPGVVKAVHEIFGGRAKRWQESRPTTIWSYHRARPRGMFGLVGSLFRKRAARARVH
jgi:predicted O-methyltransferase YrrM